MDNILRLSTSHFPLFSIHHPTSLSSSSTNTSLSFSLKTPPPSQPPEQPNNSSNLRRPSSLEPIPKKITPTKPNPLKNLINTTHVSSPPTNNPLSLSNKLRLSSKLSPPPPPPPPPPTPATPPPPTQIQENEVPDTEPPEAEFRQQGKIFVGNLPNWIKKREVAEFFRQFGPINNVILIKGYNDYEKNVGFGFVIYDGPVAEKSAMKAVEFDGVEFHGRVLTVKPDDGRRLKAKKEERVRWVEGVDEEEFRSKWHKERDRDRKEFRKTVETQPENWQAVVTAFERIRKVRDWFSWEMF